ncbi:iron chelate uptake ABC transporter family permease subunit, partial [Burkholderia multivorans]
MSARLSSIRASSVAAGAHGARRIGTQRRFAPVALGALAVLVGAMSVVALCVGAYRISPADAWAALAGDPAAQQARAVLLGIRAPRVVLALLVGGGFGAAGAAMQALFRNPLADPGLVGVSSGAALGATAAIVLGPALFAA